MYELGKNPEVQETLYSEISAHIKPNEPVTDDMLERMSYVKAVVKEAMRIHSPTPGNGRINREDVVINNYAIPKGVGSFFSISFK